jgi:triacylglycerol lipase
MNIDNSLDALFKPGISNQYFDINSPSPIYVGEIHFNLWNAWWLAELSRLIYREDRHNSYADSQSINTNEILTNVGMEKLGEIYSDETSTYGLLIKFKAFDKALQSGTSCLVLVFCGSNELQDWKTNFSAYQRRFYDCGSVHGGFQQAFLSIKDKLLDLPEIHDHPLFITGHSLGAALATLCTAYLSDHDVKLDACYTYGSPRVGNNEFADSLSCKHIYRVINDCDVITTIPFDFVAIKYKHAGHPCFIDAETHVRLTMCNDDIEQYQKIQLSNTDNIFKSGLLEKLKVGEVELYSFLTDHAPINYVAKIEENLKAVI